MNDQNINLNKAWKILSSKLSFDTESLSRQFQLALDLESKAISLEEFNKVLSLFLAMKKEDCIAKLINNYIDANLGNELFYTSEINSSIDWNEKFLFQVNILRRLHKKSASRKIDEIILKSILSKIDKVYLINVSKDEWEDYLNNVEGISLKKSVKMINHMKIINGQSALSALKEKCSLIKFSIELMESA
jgi:hypothetical protein